MKKILLLSFVLFVTNTISAQIISVADTALADTAVSKQVAEEGISTIKKGRKHKITIGNEFLFENTSLDGKLFTSGNIDLYKKTISNKLLERNVLAIQNRFGIAYSKQADANGTLHDAFGYSIGIYDRTEMDFSFSKDLFDLIFFGNKMFMGDKINLSNTSFSATRFQQINLACSRIIKINNANKFLPEEVNKFLPEEIEVGLGYSYLIGNTHLGFSANDSYIEFGEAGEYINADLNFTGNLSDTNMSAVNIFGQNGSGSAIDFMLNLKRKENNIYFSITDFGSITWKDPSVSYSANKVLTNFSGIEIDNLLNPLDSIIENQLDSLSNIDIVKKGEKFKSYLSTTYHFAYKRDLPINYIQYIIVGMISKHRRGFIPANYKPKYYLGTLFSHRGFNAKTTYSMGGYSKYAWQMEIGQNMFNQHFQFVLGTQHFESCFKGIAFSNLDFYFGLNFLFGDASH